jgi:catechol 2,3-dioxygenase-like lactoylglutathione lyase family enzyme
MKRVAGIGGIFFKAKDAPALRAWYQRHLGLDVQAWGGSALSWVDDEGKPIGGTTIWSIGATQTEQFEPGVATFMINYRAEALHALVKALREEGCNVLDKVDDSSAVSPDRRDSSLSIARCATSDSEYGKFAWAIDPEGNTVQLWQPPVG